MKGVSGIVFALCLLFSNASFALRCAHQVIEPGYTKEDVYDICGDPDSVDSHWERRVLQSQTNGTWYGFNGGQFPRNALNSGQSYVREVDVLVDEWVYDFGHSRLRQYLRFENGRLVEIRDLGRGRR
jgi:hypothetical protein